MFYHFSQIKQLYVFFLLFGLQFLKVSRVLVDFGEYWNSRKLNYTNTLLTFCDSRDI